MYIGLGVQAVPRYEGAAGHRNAILPVLQVAWSNGLFVSGMSAGMHWSSSPSVEYGPLIALAPGRDASGNRLFRLATAGDSGADGSPPTTWLPSTGIGEGPVDSHPVDENVPQSIEASNNRLEGMATIGRRVVYGGFANVYVARQWRLTGNVLYGAGNDRRGLRAVLSIQHLAQQLAPHHALSLSAGVSLVNRAYNQAYFGVTEYEAGHTMNLRHAPDGGLQDVRVAARWNWALSPSWMLTTGMQASRLLGDAKRSPLVERATNLSASSALAYRF
ncbi:MipA/OmpV family protein [Massilia sp. YMA4]|uniref:MipA/OmpV family protein n=1 Tax=Massilia sp. YMA4 TaxID=1593482 RepID=UPI001D0CC583|nr:MipA/OmpV family protein [Massilia sp. YMA4]